MSRNSKLMSNALKEEIARALGVYEKYPQRIAEI